MFGAYLHCKCDIWILKQQHALIFWWLNIGHFLFPWDQSEVRQPLAAYLASLKISPLSQGQKWDIFDMSMMTCTCSTHVGEHLQVWAATANHKKDIKSARMPIMQIDHLIPTGPSVTRQPRWPEINTLNTWYKRSEQQRLGVEWVREVCVRGDNNPGGPLTAVWIENTMRDRKEDSMEGSWGWRNKEAEVKTDRQTETQAGWQTRHG